MLASPAEASSSSGSKIPRAGVMGKWERRGCAAEGAAGWAVPRGVRLHPAVLPRQPPRVHGWGPWPTRLDPGSRSPTGSCHSLVRGCRHIPHPAGRWGQGSPAAMSRGAISCGAQGCVGAPKRCTLRCRQQRGCWQMMLQATLPRSLVSEG